MTRGRNVHTALCALAAEWGASGLLTDLEQLAADQHAAGRGPLPHDAEGLVRALARFVGAYAPWGAASSPHAWRDDPCPLCAAVAATEQEMTRA